MGPRLKTNCLECASKLTSNMIHHHFHMRTYNWVVYWGFKDETWGFIFFSFQIWQLHLNNRLVILYIHFMVIKAHGKTKTNIALILIRSNTCDSQSWLFLIPLSYRLPMKPENITEPHLAPGDIFPNYDYPGHCGLFWVSHTWTFLLPEILTRTPSVY